MNLHRARTAEDLGSTPNDLLLEPGLLSRITCPADLRTQPRSSLYQYVDAVRAELIDIVSQTGGHLGAGLGVVELTVALHYVFETPDDKLIWDVSHQCYPHKILTGRRDAMRRVRMGGGPSGFTNRKESIFDPFGAAHSSTAISAGLGYAAARDLKDEKNHIVAIVGDGAMTGGMAYEGLNNAGAHRGRLIIILNDNNMSISPPAGALQHALHDLRESMPEAPDRRRAIQENDRLPSFAAGPTLFDALGVRYAGPFDGHDIDEMVDVLALAKEEDAGPILVHVVTEKGRGYLPAMEAGCKYHGVSKFNILSGKQIKAKASAPSYTSVFAKALIAEAQADEKVVAVTAAMASGTGLDKFGTAFPDRCFDVGIAEQHAVTFCGGLACEGFKPFAAIYSTFLQRGFDQIVHDIAIQRLPVRFMMDRAGLVGADGVTHQGSYDIAYLGCLPGFVLMAPADEAELVHMVATAAAIEDRPSAVRYPRGEGLGVELPDRGTPLEVGRGRIVQQGDTIALLGYGACFKSVLEAAQILGAMGLSTTVADARFAKPIDDRLVKDLVQNHKVLISVEEGASGGFATQLVNSIERQALPVNMERLAFMHLPDRFIDHDTQTAQTETAGLSAQAIVARALEKLKLDRTVARDTAWIAAE